MVNRTFIWPTRGNYPTGNDAFGAPRGDRLHMGVDIAIGLYGEPVRAAHSGTVIHVAKTGTYGGYGDFIQIKHPDIPYYTHYGHMGVNHSEEHYKGHQTFIWVRKGQRVEAGEVIGLVGCSGHSYSPHLHFEVYNPVESRCVDPMSFGYINPSPEIIRLKIGSNVAWASDPWGGIRPVYMAWHPFISLTTAWLRAADFKEFGYNVDHLANMNGNVKVRDFAVNQNYDLHWDGSKREITLKSRRVGYSGEWGKGK